MKRKKQGDFQKTKLKVGKLLPKGRNETKTAFQTRKIKIPEQIRETPGEPTLKELLSFMKSTDVNAKFDNLRKLHKYVSNNKDTLSMFFPEILKELGRTLLEDSSRVRSEAISVIGKCAQILTDIQIKSFVVPLTSYLNCIMTHPNLSIRRDSLEFLDVLLNSHPSVICQSFEILFNLLSLISHKESSSGKKEIKNKKLRKLSDIVADKITAEDWRSDVLKRMLSFLNGMVLAKNSSAMNTDDQKEIHWDAKEALYLPLYLNSGVEPAKFDFSLYCSANLEGNDSKNIKDFINELICVLSAILKGIGFHKEKSFSEATINYLSIISQILCCLGEWTPETFHLNDDLKPAENLIKICCQLLLCFPYDLQSVPRSSKREKAECVELNLEICYLYCMCSQLSDTPGNSYLDAWKQIHPYLGEAFKVSGAKLNERSISLALKITKAVVQSKNLDKDAKNGLLLGLLGALDTNKFSPTATDLYSFFMELSLNYDYDYLLGTTALRIWFSELMKYLIFMMESKKFVPNFLNYIKQVCARRNHYFMQTLNSIESEKFIEMLKFDDEDVQLTIIHLIVSLDKISSDFFDDIIETIRDATFSFKTASRLIRLLHSRFSKSTTPRIDQMNFVRFLLNLACDTFLILDPSLDSDPLPLTDMIINFQQSFACQCEIYPTSDFKRHQEIFEVCAEYLSDYLRNGDHAEITFLFIRSIFTDHVRFPVHSVVAFFELFKRYTFLYSYNDFLQNFVYSCLLCNSLITNDVPDEHWTEYCVEALQGYLYMVDPREIMTFVDNNAHTFKENQLYHIIRIFLFLMKRRALDSVGNNSIYCFLNKLSKLDAFPKGQVIRIILNNMFEYLHQNER